MFRNLEAELVRHGVTIKALAAQLGVSPKTVRNKIQGKTEFTLSEILTIHSLLSGCDISYLFIQTRDTA